MLKKIDRDMRIIIVFLVIVFAITIGGAVAFVKGIENNDFVFVIIGGVFFLIGFYAVSASIKRYFELKFLRKLAEEIEKKRTVDIVELGQLLEKSPNKIDVNIMKLIKGEYIYGYYYDHKNIEKIEDRNKRLSEKERIISTAAAKEVETKQKILQEELYDKQKLRGGRCEYCGANVVFRGKDTICPYCGNLVVAK